MQVLLTSTYAVTLSMTPGELQSLALALAEATAAVGNWRSDPRQLVVLRDTLWQLAQGAAQGP